MNGTMNPGLLQRVAAQRDKAPAARRAILDVVLEDPDRVLAESFELPARRAHSSVPTVMRTCRDRGFAGLREFKLALAHELALGGPPLHRRVNVGNSAEDIVAKVTRSAAATVAGVRSQLDLATLEAAVSAIDDVRHIDLFATGITSWFPAQDLQARLFRLGLSTKAWVDDHLQRVVSLTQPGTPLADRTDILLGLSVPDDAVMHVGIDAYPTHLTVDRAGRAAPRCSRKMKVLTARNFRNHDRGLLRAGRHADVVVFDPARIQDLATYDRPAQASLGITVVYVNGVRSHAEAEGAAVLARAGRILARGEPSA